MTQKLDVTNIINKGKSPVILTGPHNGWIVPDEYIYDGMPLGVEPYWFDPLAENRRHEACDWGMAPLFDAIQKRSNDYCMLSSNISRLVVDLNRIPAMIIYEGSSETGEDIPGNQKLDEAHIQKRLETFYNPYHDALSDIIADTKKQFGNVIWLDLHSFTPIWQGKKRQTGVGTLKLVKNDYTLKAEALLENTFKELFAPDLPYDLSLSPHREINAGSHAGDKHGVDYLGIEIRNDLLSTKMQINMMAESLVDIIEKLR